MKSERERSLSQNLCDQKHFWQLMKPVRNCMLSTFQLLFLKTNSGPPCSLEAAQLGCALCWMIFEKSQMYNLKKLFPVEAMVAPKSVTPFGRGARRLGSEQTTRFPGNPFTGASHQRRKIFLECPEKCRPNPIFFCHP